MSFWLDLPVLQEETETRRKNLRTEANPLWSCRASKVGILVQLENFAIPGKVTTLMKKSACWLQVSELFTIDF